MPAGPAPPANGSHADELVLPSASPVEHSPPAVTPATGLTLRTSGAKHPLPNEHDHADAFASARTLHLSPLSTKRKQRRGLKRVCPEPTPAHGSLSDTAAEAGHQPFAGKSFSTGAMRPLQQSEDTASGEQFTVTGPATPSNASASPPTTDVEIELVSRHPAVHGAGAFSPSQASCNLPGPKAGAAGLSMRSSTPPHMAFAETSAHGPNAAAPSLVQSKGDPTLPPLPLLPRAWYQSSSKPPSHTAPCAGTTAVARKSVDLSFLPMSAAAAMQQ
jgi:hypothetical protein